MSFNPFKIYYEEEEELISTFSSKEKKMNYYGPKILINYNVLGNLSACVFRSSMLNYIPKEWFEYNITDWFLGIALAEISPVAQFSEEMSVYRVSAKGLWSQHSEEIKTAKKENLTYTYDRMLGYRFTREFFGYRLASKVKNKRDQWIKKVPRIPNRLIIRLFSQGIIFRMSNVIAQVVPLKIIKRDVELYKVF